MFRLRSPRPVFVLGYILLAFELTAAQELQASSEGSNIAGRVEQLEKELDKASKAYSSSLQATSEPIKSSQVNSQCPCIVPATDELQSHYRTLRSCVVERIRTSPTGGSGIRHQCLDHIPPNATVYSIGIGNGDQVEYDKEMTRRGHRVFGFDPSVEAVRLKTKFEQNPPGVWSNFDFMPIGLGVKDGVARFLNFLGRKGGVVGLSLSQIATSSTKKVEDRGFEASVLSLPSMMALHRHDHVDLLKIDVEGLEFDICESKAFLSALKNVGQILLKFNGNFLKHHGHRTGWCIALLRDQGFLPVFATWFDEYTFARVVVDAIITDKADTAKE